MISTTEHALQIVPHNGVQAQPAWDNVRKYADAARKMACGQLACQVMAGLELLELRKVHGKQGARTDLATSGNHFPKLGESASHPVKLLTWEEACLEHAGITKRTALNWMKMAEAIKPRLKKLMGREAFTEVFNLLLTLPISFIPAEKFAILEKAVHKITDGKTQLDFLCELGFGKSPGKGGNNPKGANGSETKLSMEERQAEILRLAREDWKELTISFGSYSHRFAALTDAEIQGQIGLLEFQLEARKLWLSKRDLKAVEKFFKVR